MHQTGRDKKIGVFNEKIVKACMDYDIVNELKKKKQQLEDYSKMRINDQLLVQQWLKKAIHQNIGVFTCHDKELVYDSKSLYLFKYDSKLRQGIVWITEWKWFDIFVITLILVGSICQAIYRYEGGAQNKEYNDILDLIMTITSMFFILEASLKIIS